MSESDKEDSASRTPADMPSQGREQYIDPALRARYDIRGPRYTSYPPATHFHDIETQAVQERWLARNCLEDDPGLSLYFHIPFCRFRCLFCACYSITGAKTSQSSSYVNELIAEMALTQAVVDRRRVVHQIALGGGTPNYLPSGAIDELLSAAETHWDIAPEAELSAEIDPRTVTPANLDVLLTHHFNRFSLGVQDFAEEVITRVRRGQDRMKVEKVIQHLRKAGCGEINFDFIYGLPGQDEQTAAATANQAVALGPSRIALYSYAHVPWIQPHQKALERYGLPDPDRKATIFHTMADIFRNAGYIQIGMDHFALPEDSLARAFFARTLRRNFMGYTTGRNLDTLGFGISAISSVGSAYSQNTKELETYRAALSRKELPAARGYLLSRDDEIRRELLLELFCNFRADLRQLSSNLKIDAGTYFLKDLKRLEPMVNDGLVRWNSEAIEVTDLGRFFIRNICMTFDRHLETESSKQIYSRTV